MCFPSVSLFFLSLCVCLSVYLSVCPPPPSLPFLFISVSMFGFFQLQRKCIILQVVIDILVLGCFLLLLLHTETNIAWFSILRSLLARNNGTHTTMSSVKEFQEAVMHVYVVVVVFPSWTLWGSPGLCTHTCTRTSAGTLHGTLHRVRGSLL